LGGIYSGVFTATEAASVACVYALIIGLFVYKQLKLSDLKDIFSDSAVSTGQISLLIANAVLFGWLLVTQQIPQDIARSILSVTENKYIILLLFNLFMLVAGCLINTTAAIVLVTPIFLPTLVAVRTRSFIYRCCNGCKPCHRYDNATCWAEFICSNRS